MADQKIDRIIDTCKTIAMVGISDKEGRPSNTVAKYLKNHGYRIIPVNPNLKQVLGETCYPDLKSIPEPVDVVDIFRRSEETDSLIDEAIAINPKAIWMQLGVTNPEGAAKAEAAGIEVIMDKCLKIEHNRKNAGT
jgi:predicted CoA-binding protein